MVVFLLCLLSLSLSLSLSPSILSLTLILLMSDIWIAHRSVLLITADGAIGEERWSENKRPSAHQSATFFSCNVEYTT